MNPTGRDTNIVKAADKTQATDACCLPSDKDGWILAALKAKRYEKVVEDLLPRIKYWICEHHNIAADDAEELAIETIRRVGDKVFEFAGRSTFFSWVIGFAKFVVLEHFNLHPDHKASSFDCLAAERDTDRRAEDMDFEETDAETIALRNMGLEDVKSTLTVLEATAHKLCFDQGYTYQQAAHHMGGDATANSVAKALQRATEKIGNRMKEQGYYP